MDILPLSTCATQEFNFFVRESDPALWPAILLRFHFVWMPHPRIRAAVHRWSRGQDNTEAKFLLRLTGTTPFRDSDILTADLLFLDPAVNIEEHIVATPEDPFYPLLQNPEPRHFAKLIEALREIYSPEEFVAQVLLRADELDISQFYDLQQLPLPLLPLMAGFFQP